VADAAPPLEIFEAGTGSGSLTLHLARAIHGANPPVPPELRKALCLATYAPRQPAPEHDGESPAPELDPHPLDLSASALGSDATRLNDLHATREAYLASRRAVIHSLDINHAHSRLAHRTIRHFRRAQYLLDVSFHVGTIGNYLVPRLAQSGGAPFLSHAILDLPGAHEHAAPVVDALRPDGTLIVFYPSVTQIAEFAAWARRNSKPLVLDRALELPLSTGTESLRGGSGGREWDVRVVTPRIAEKIAQEAAESDASESSTSDADESAAPTDESGSEPEPDRALSGREVFVCRPKVGVRVAGGGFLAVFRRVLDTKPASL
jgi:hypothetical protein